MNTFRILSIDGGGIRGIYSAVLINRILRDIPELIRRTIFFAGTSSGSLLAFSLAYGLPPMELIELFKAIGQEVYKNTLVKQVSNLVGAKYDIYNMRKILTPYFGAAILQEFGTVHRKLVLAPAFDLDGEIEGVRTWKPKFFHNFPGPDSDAGELAVDVISRSSATPIYFQSYQGYIDGGVVARNPSMAALALAINPIAGRQSIENIRMLSIGSGNYPRYIAGQKQDWGLGRWSWPLVTLMLDGEVGVNHYQAMQILGPRNYHRLAPILPEPVGLDEADKIPDLIRYANEVDIRPTVKWIRSFYLETENAPNGDGVKISLGEGFR
ncbi:MAG: patatin-like phospholipase family protein [Candidatus Promineifilaceae bacterium]|nr:patatin-like phospholipase family protein [Candidatus Promineifilaceae bacterium]